MKVALIPPIALNHCHGDSGYYLMLPQNLKYEAYEEHFRKVCRDNSNFVILDNGAAENEFFHPSALLAIAGEFGVDEIVLPDVIGDGGATFRKTAAFFDYCNDADMERFYFMYVVQGKTYEECCNSIDFMNKYPVGRVDTFGIPRHLVSNASPTIRGALAEYILETTDKEIHFLGGSYQYPDEVEFLEELVGYNTKVRGIDTSMPFVYAAGARELDGWRYNPIQSRPEGYFDLEPGDAEGRGLADHNVAVFLRWASDKNLKD